MKIAIDVSQVVYGTGVSVYTKLLVDNLLKLDDKDDYLLFGGSLRQKRKLKEFLGTLDGRFTTKLFSIPPTLADIIWNKLHILPIERLVGKIDVFHSSDWSQPPSDAFKVTTVHDLFPIKYPKLTHPKVVSVHLSRLKRVIKDVNSVITPSLTTKGDLVAYGMDEGRITVIPEAPDPVFTATPKIEIERVKRKYQISGRYLLAIGINARKNTERIIAAYEKVKPGMELKLVIVGHPYMKIDLVRGVKILGYVSLSDLPALYSGSETLVYPSLYEGFGFPILEAFKCKTPVVTSNLGTMLELGKGAAVLVEPTDVDSIAEGVKMAINKREILVKEGLEKVKAFSWMQVAQNTLEVYQKAGS